MGKRGPGGRHALPGAACRRGESCGGHAGWRAACTSRRWRPGGRASTASSSKPCRCSPQTANRTLPPHRQGCHVSLTMLRVRTLRWRCQVSVASGSLDSHSFVALRALSACNVFPCCCRYRVCGCRTLMRSGAHCRRCGPGVPFKRKTVGLHNDTFQHAAPACRACGCQTPMRSGARWGAHWRRFGRPSRPGAARGRCWPTW